MKPEFKKNDNKRNFKNNNRKNYDNRDNKPKDEKYTIYINATALFGGVEIK